ncbi:MAG: hypothetical protein FJW39_08615 [Acidobacteria bacterium]|nr:hypothetical protein [Acidobacteriota bacterium]
MSDGPVPQVFLGGSCGSTTWRRDVAIPILRQAGVTYYDPQLPPGTWTEADEVRDVQAKAAARVLLFVVSGETRAVASLCEVAYLIGQGRPLALAVEWIPEPATWLSAFEREDLNRGRMFARTMAERHQVPVFTGAAEAARHAVTLVRALTDPLTLEVVLALLSEVEFPGVRFTAEPALDGFFVRVLGPDKMEGRNWWIPATISRSDLIRTAFKAAITWTEHEAREMFRFRGDTVFGPHIDVERLRGAIRD